MRRLLLGPWPRSRRLQVHEIQSWKLRLSELTRLGMTVTAPTGSCSSGELACTTLGTDFQVVLIFDFFFLSELATVFAMRATCSRANYPISLPNRLPFGPIPRRP